MLYRVLFGVPLGLIATRQGIDKITNNQYLSFPQWSPKVVDLSANLLLFLVIQFAYLISTSWLTHVCHTSELWTSNFWQHENLKILATQKLWQQKILKKFWLYRNPKRSFWQKSGGKIIILNPQKITISQIFTIETHLFLSPQYLWSLCLPSVQG